jgi:acetolactate synthase-1/3 small subunit
LVQDKPGVLNKLAGMVRRRGFNISSLTVAQSEQTDYSRMTFVVEGDDSTITQVINQLYKIIEVVKVTDITKENVVIRELALIKISTTPASRPEILQLVEIFRSNVLDVSSDSVIVEVTGDENKVDSLLAILEPFGIKEVMRTGRVGLIRGVSNIV